MKLVIKLSFVFVVILTIPNAYAETDNLPISKIEVYTSKAKIPYMGSNGLAIPENIPIVVMRTSDGTYSHWYFVSYGDSMSQFLAFWLSAKALGKNVSCVSEDRGNYWVQCVGTSFE